MKKLILFVLMVAGVNAASPSVLAAIEQELYQKKTKAEQDAVFNRLTEFTTPGERHQFLKSLEGSWNAKITFRAAPEVPYAEMQNTAEAKMIMDGRYLDKWITGADGSFKARITYGFDNFRKEFTITWIDNMCTGMITSTGVYDDATKTLNEQGNLSCPLTNQPHRWFRAATKFTDADHYTYEMYKKDDDGEEFRGMLIEFSRIK